MKVTVSSFFANVEHLLAESTPRSAQWRLGSRWGFGFEIDDPVWEEFSCPFPTTSFVNDLDRRAGVVIREHRDNVDESLFARLESGEAAIVAVDSFYLPYRPAYGRVHSSRTIIARNVVSGVVYVEDIWQPTFNGNISWETLLAARHSDVSFDGDREPVFSGQPLRGRWFDVSARSFNVTRVPEYFGQLLESICNDGLRTNPAGGIGEMNRMLDIVRSGRVAKDVDVRRSLALLLRSELSTRVYLVACLRQIALILDDDALASGAGVFLTELAHLENARDTLVKSLRLPRPEYERNVLVEMEKALVAEERLASVITSSICVMRSNA